MNLPKFIASIIICALFIWCGYDPFNHGFLHMINFPIHEIGHILFIPLGKFLVVAGGSIFQIALPVFCFLYFFLKRNFFSASIVILWIGNNFIDVGFYARDAIFRELPLANLMGESENLVHDWNYLLTSTNTLPYCDFIAGIFFTLGILISLIGAVGCFYFSLNDEEKI